MLKKLKSLLSYQNLIIATLALVVLKILYITVFQKEFLGNEDFLIAKNVVQYHQYSQFINQGGTAFKLPVYPYVISFFILLQGTNALIGLAVFQAILSFFIPLLIYKIINLFGFKDVGILAGFLFICSPAYFLYPGIIEATNIFVPILLLWFYLYFRVWILSEIRTLDFIILGIVTALLSLTQVVICPLAFLMIVALLFFKKIDFKGFTIIFFVAMVFYSPWVIRNYYVFDKIVLSKTPAWQNIYFGFTPKGQLLDDLKLVSKKRDHYLYQMSDTVSELTMENIYKNEVMKATNKEPHYFIKKAASNFLCLWFVPPKYFEDNSLPVLAGRKIYVIILNILTLLSLACLYKKSRLLFWFSLLLFANFSVPYMIGHAANMRFKLDFEWYQLILVSYLIIELSKSHKKNAPV